MPSDRCFRLIWAPPPERLLLSWREGTPGLTLHVAFVLQAAIRKELNEFKSNEMEVHSSSKHLTRSAFALFPLIVSGQWHCEWEVHYSTSISAHPAELKFSCIQGPWDEKVAPPLRYNECPHIFSLRFASVGLVCSLKKEKRISRGCAYAISHLWSALSIWLIIGLLLETMLTLSPLFGLAGSTGLSKVSSVKSCLNLVLSVKTLHKVFHWPAATGCPDIWVRRTFGGYVSRNGSAGRRRHMQQASLLLRGTSP